MKSINQTLRIFVLTAVLFSFCMAKTYSQSKKISVTLKDSLTNAPLQNIRVDINSFEKDKFVKLVGVSTDEKGFATYLASDTAKRYQVSIKQDGYKEKRAYITFGDDEKEDTFVNFSLKISKKKL